MWIKIYKLCTVFFVIVVLFSCNFAYKIHYNENNVTYDYNKLFESEIIFPKNQTNSQSLSIIIKNNNGEIIIFDGGRDGDAEFLYNFIKNNGAVVKAWFLTHIHDDHIGALYKILSDEKFSDIKIENLIYNFADLNWYFDKIGFDAGYVMLFNTAVSNFKNINIVNKLDKNDVFDFSSVKVTIINDMYKIDTDPINNSSIVYKVNADNSNMIIFGDLGFEGGHKLINDLNNKEILLSDILVLSHHGQNGVPLEIYDYVKPTFIIWPTTKEIYENVNNKYKTDNTKEYFKDYSLKQQFLTFENTYIIN